MNPRHQPQRSSSLGNGTVKTFNVHIPVKKGRWLAFKGKYADTLFCGAGFDTEVQFQPALPVGRPPDGPLRRL